MHFGGGWGRFICFSFSLYNGHVAYQLNNAFWKQKCNYSTFINMYTLPEFVYVGEILTLDSINLNEATLQMIIAISHSTNASNLCGGFLWLPMCFSCHSMQFRFACWQTFRSASLPLDLFWIHLILTVGFNFNTHTIRCYFRRLVLRSFGTDEERHVIARETLNVKLVCFSKILN